MLISKRYLLILSLAAVSVLLGTMSYNYVTLADRAREATEVEIVNLPIDEQGNLRTATIQSSKIMLVFNETVTVSSSTTQYTYLTSFNTSGFKYAYLMAKGQGSWDIGATVKIWFFENNLGIQTFKGGIAPYVSLNTGSETTRPDWGCGSSAKNEIHSTSTDLYLQVNNSGVGFDGLLTIVVYLSN